jgi:hypothetical protein
MLHFTINDDILSLKIKPNHRIGLFKKERINIDTKIIKNKTTTYKLIN